MRDRNERPAEEFKNVYNMKGEKIVSDASRKRYAPGQNSKYKTADRKRKAHSANQKKRRRILRGALFIFFTVAILVSAFFGLSQIFCKVDTITIKYTNKAYGTKRYYADKDILRSTGIEKGDNLIFVSSADIGAELEKKMPYISSAVVKKDFPSGVLIEVTECAKIYAYKGKDGYCLADEKGKFIELVGWEKAKKYIVVTCSGVESTQTGERLLLGKQNKETELYPDTEKIVEYLALLKKSGMKITSVDIRDLTDISMVYDGRIDVHVGRMSDEENGVTAWRKLQLAKNALVKQDEISKKQKGKLELAISKKAYFKAEQELPTEEKTTTNG